jgi:two-component system sensor histidine kinase and response regulator WspE
MQRLKRKQSELEHSLDRLRSGLDSQALTPQSAAQLTELFAKAAETREFLADRLSELDHYDRRSVHLSSQLYFEVLRTRMQPFQDGTRRFPRMVRDLSQALGKQVRLEVLGGNTQVDRDILERLEAPLIHLLRNAVDHGCELPEVRAAAGKPPEAVIQLEARHSAGLLLVSVSDDGAGLDTNRLRRVVVEKQLTTLPLAERMGDAELVEFLFLPGFTMKGQITEISGRGVGLDVVRDMVRSVRGKIRVAAQSGRGTRFQMQLPLTLSVLRSLLVEVAGEPYAIPLAQITRTLRLNPNQIETLEGRPHFAFGDQRLGLITARQVFGCATEVSRGMSERASATAAGAKCQVSGSDTRPLIPRTSEGGLPVVVLGGHHSQYGLLVDRFLGERELIVRPLDPRLGKVKDISAAALMEDGAPVLIMDVDELVHSLHELTASSPLT